MPVLRSSPFLSLPRWMKGALAGFLLLMPAAMAVACPLCYEAARQTLTEGIQLDMADRVVLAAIGPAANQFRIVAIIKGMDAVGDSITDPVAGADAAAAVTTDPFLLIRDPVASQWTSLGTIPVESADWLRQLVATLLVKGDRPRPPWPLTMRTSFTLSYAGWRQRIALILPYLDNPNPLVASIAWGELARAPYSALDVAKSRIAATTLTGWLSDPKLVSRHATCLLLLGLTGSAADAERLEKQIETAWTAHDTTNLAPMIGADLELRGPSRVDWIESMYFADRTRTLPEVEAALLALSVHGDSNRTVPRERVIQAYRVFIKERPPMAGFVAPQLADWNYWDATADYEALLNAKALKDPASEFAVLTYLRRAASAKAALQ